MPSSASSLLEISLPGSSSLGRNGESNNKTNDWLAIALEVVKFGVTIGLTIYFANKSFKIIKDILGDPSGSAAGALRIANMKKDLARRLKRPDVELLDFDIYEMKMIGDVIAADELNTTFADVGGLDNQLEELKENVILPMKLWHMVLSEEQRGMIPTAPTGVLLYGSPGTGKSLMAKAIAKESSATFLNVKASSLNEKWFGESDKLVSAMFRLARKLAPTVLFIDEIETLLKKRESGNGSNPALHSMQGVFLTEWDGLQTDANSSSADDGSAVITPDSIGKPAPFSSLPAHLRSSPQQNSSNSSTSNKKMNAPVVVLGATNRPKDLDKAFLRRMPVQIQTKVPSLEGLLAILQTHLRSEQLDSGVDLHELATCIVYPAAEYRSSAQKGATEGEGEEGKGEVNVLNSSSSSSKRRFDNDAMAQLAEECVPSGATGSDIREIVRVARMQRMKALVRQFSTLGSAKSDPSAPSAAAATTTDNVGALNAAPLSREHFSFALEKFRAAATSQEQYSNNLARQEIIDKIKMERALLRAAAAGEF